jgi:predicted dehydrogenase
MANFAVIGVGGFVAPRHLRPIRDTGSRLVAAVDPNDSVGVLDQFNFDVRYFREIERFDRHRCLDLDEEAPLLQAVAIGTKCYDDCKR